MSFETIVQRHEHALAVVRTLLGEESSDNLRHAAATGFGAAIARMAVDDCFAASWGQGELADRDRSLVMLGVLIAQGHDKELQNHVKIAVGNGLSEREIEDALTQAAPYVGVPAIAKALTAIVEALRAIGRDSGMSTAEEVDSR